MLGVRRFAVRQRHIAMRRKLAVLVASLIVIIFLPIALFGLMASVNEYRDQGISGAVDCNGPLTVMLFVAPSLVVYTTGAIYYAVLLKRGRRSLLTAVLMVICVATAFAAGGKAWAAYREKSRPEHQETCGEGW
jgi:hypothetical protein